MSTRFFDCRDPALGQPVPFGVEQRAAQTLAGHFTQETQSLVQRCRGRGQIAVGASQSCGLDGAHEVVQVEPTRCQVQQVTRLGPGQQGSVAARRPVRLDRAAKP
jgi:hypothetical protein